MLRSTKKIRQRFGMGVENLERKGDLLTSKESELTKKENDQIKEELLSSQRPLFLPWAHLHPALARSHPRRRIRRPC